MKGRNASYHRRFSGSTPVYVTCQDISPLDDARAVHGIRYLVVCQRRSVVVYPAPCLTRAVDHPEEITEAAASGLAFLLYDKLIDGDELVYNDTGIEVSTKRSP